MAPEIRVTSIFLNAYRNLPDQERRQVKTALKELSNQPDTVCPAPIQGAPGIHGLMVNERLRLTFELCKDKTITLRVLGNIRQSNNPATSAETHN